MVWGEPFMFPMAITRWRQVDKEALPAVLFMSLCPFNCALEALLENHCSARLLAS